MGIPKLFSFIRERYPNVVQLIKANEVSVLKVDYAKPETARRIETMFVHVHQIPDYDNLFLDMNAIVHACSANLKTDPRPTIDHHNIIHHVQTTIETLYRLVAPRKRIFLAFDGVAPQAKWNKQRQRRFVLEKNLIDSSPICHRDDLLNQFQSKPI